MDGFFQKVYEIVAQVPAGKVVSYGQIARMIGHPRAARIVGYAMRVCPDDLPWQRVVKTDGSVTGGAFEAKRLELLKQEGVIFQKDGRIDMRRCQWEPELGGMDAYTLEKLLE